MGLTAVHVAITTASGATSAQTPAYTSFTPNVGDYVVVVAYSKHRTESTSPTAPGPWPLVASNAGGVTGSAVDQGKVRISAFARTLDGSADDALPLISMAAGTGVLVSLSSPYVYRKDSAGVYTFHAQFVEQTSSATVWSGTTASTPDWTSGDHLLVASGATTDAVTGMGTRVLTATGCTFGGATEQFDAASTQGDDVRFVCATNTVTAGPASSTATVGITLLTVASTGQQAVFRVRHVASSSVTLTPATATLTAVALDPDPQPVTVNLTPAVATLSAVALEPDPGVVSVTLTPATATLTAVPLNPVPGPVAVALTPAVATLTAVPLDPVSVGSSVTLTPAVATLSAVALDPQPGPVSVTLTPATATLTAMALDPEPGAVTVVLTPAVATLTAVELAAVPGSVTVTLVPATATLTAVALDPQAIGADDGSPELDASAGFAPPTWRSEFPSDPQAAFVADQWRGAFE